MFSPNRSLLNVHFEGYKLSPDLHMSTKSLPLPCCLAIPDSEASQFQVLADSILQNHLFINRKGTDDMQKVQAVLGDGQVVQVDTDGLHQIGKIRMGEFVCTASGPYVSNGIDLLCHDVTLTIEGYFRYSPEQYPLKLIEYSAGLLLCYQIVPSAACESIWPTKSPKGSHLFLLSVVELAQQVQVQSSGRIVSEMGSWTRPLLAHCEAGNIILGSSSGFFSITGENSRVVQEEEDLQDEESVVGVERPMACEDVDEEDMDSNSSAEILLKAFLPDGRLLASAPPAHYLSHITDSEGRLLIATQSGVDALIFHITLHFSPTQTLATTHIYTLNAFAFIQAGKPRKRFIGFAKDMAVLAEGKDLVYVYRMDGITENEARQVLVSLGKDRRILGMRIIEENNIVILTSESIEIININIKV